MQKTTLPPSAGPLPSGVVVVDPTGDTFVRIRALDLGCALWRTTQPPLDRDLPEGTTVVLVVEDAPDWDVVEELSRRHATIIATHYPRQEDALTALRDGAFGYVDLTLSNESVRRTLLGAVRGEPAFRREALGAWLREGRHGSRSSNPASGAFRLTARQREIVGLIASGATDKEIGAALGIRTATAQKHVANLLRRLGVANRAAAVGIVFKDEATLPPVRPRADRRRR